MNSAAVPAEIFSNFRKLRGFCGRQSTISMATQLYFALDPKINLPSDIPKSAVRWGPEDQAKLSGVKAGSMSKAWVSSPAPFSSAYIAHLLTVIAPGGELSFHTSGKLSDIERSLLFGGFTDIKTSASSVVARKPKFAMGAAKKFKKAKIEHGSEHTKENKVDEKKEAEKVICLGRIN
eukprot:1337159-Amorphochlora_amoeboformis.AAC.1